MTPAVSAWLALTAMMAGTVGGGLLLVRLASARGWLRWEVVGIALVVLAFWIGFVAAGNLLMALGRSRGRM